MPLKDIISVAASVIVSLGGGGAIVFGLSSFLGRLWADRALEEQRHEFARINLHLQSQLDAIGLIHKLRTTEEFNRLAGLWKRIAILRSSFNSISAEGLTLTYSDKTHQKEWEEKKRAKFHEDLYDAQLFLNEEALFIPKAIADKAQMSLKQGSMEQFSFFIYSPQLGEGGDARLRMEYSKGSCDLLAQFDEYVCELEMLMREHIAGHEKVEETGRRPSD